MLQHIFWTLVIGGPVLLGVGYWAHYRYGASVKNAVASIETRVQSEAKKL